MNQSPSCNRVAHGCTRFQFLPPTPTHQPPYVGMLKQNPPQVGEFSGPGGIRTRDFFSAIDEQLGEKCKKAVYYVYFVPKSPYCYCISVPEL
jgi:hypothetical protein